MNVGIVAEGPRDFDVFVEVMDYLSPNTFSFFPIQPNVSETEGFGSYGAGWKGVIKWCEQFTDSNKIGEYINLFIPKLDILIIHVDADIARETEINCYCEPIDVQKTVDNLKELINDKLDDSKTDSPIIFCIPSDNTEAWILCAYAPELHNPPEEILEGIQKPDYHLANKPLSLLKKKNGKPKKSEVKYRDELIPKLLQEWNNVRVKCTQAEKFSNDVLSSLR